MHRMTRALRSHDWPQGLLVSVRDAAEAAAALGGATIVDVKEPSRGPLGRPDASVAAEVLRAVDGRAAVTIACGELVASPSDIALYIEDVLARLPVGLVGPVAVKAGPSGLDPEAWLTSFQAIIAEIPGGIEAVAVAYADNTEASCLPPEEVLESAARCGARTVLIDTFDKSGPGLLERVDATVLQGWVEQAHRHRLSLALAGKLTPTDVVVATSLGADVVGVRSAACDGGRLGRVDPVRVRALGRLIADCRVPGIPRTPGVLIS